MRAAIISTFVLLQVAGCSGPMGPIPGKELEGVSAPWPSDWSFTDSVENVLLQTNPQDPYSVTVWGVYQDNTFYVAAGSSSSSWVKNIQQDGRVVLSVENRLYAARATTMTDIQEINSILTLYISKYEIEPEGNFIEDGGVLFKLSADVAADSNDPLF